MEWFKCQTATGQYLNLACISRVEFDSVDGTANVFFVSGGERSEWIVLKDEDAKALRRVLDPIAGRGA